MIGIDENTGKRIEGIAYLQQRIKSILSMRLGTSVMRPHKGSGLPNMIDAPLNASGVFELQVAAINALDDEKNNGLSDFDVETIKVLSSSNGRAIIAVSGEYLPEGKSITLDGIEL